MGVNQEVVREGIMIQFKLSCCSLYIPQNTDRNMSVMFCCNKTSKYVLM